jgi:hypothetical protein
MRRRSFRISIASILVLAGVVAAATFGFVGRGEAAGAHVCAVPSNFTQNPPTPASCLSEQLAPLTLKAGVDGLAITKFVNQSTSTASHTALTVFFSAPVTVDGFSLVVNGKAASTANCKAFPTTDSTAPQPGTTATCGDIGSTAGGNFDKLILKYQLATAGTDVNVYARVTYGESGSDSGKKQVTVNDRQQSQIATAQVSPAGTVLESACPGLTGGSSATLSATDTQVKTSILYTAASDSFLPCTPVSAAIIQTIGVNTEIALVDFPEVSGPGYASIVLDFFSSPVKAKDFVLYEALPPSFAFTPENRIVVLPCDATGMPQNPGVPPAKATESTLQVNDSCISTAPKSIPGGGVEVGVHAIASPLDSHYGG